MNKTINIGSLIEEGDNEIFTGENFEKFLINLNYLINYFLLVK